jgi:uncharacterized protein YkwD
MLKMWLRRSFLALATLALTAGLTAGVHAKMGSFRDVPSEHWAAEAIEWGVGLGIVRGYPDGTFRPDQPVTEAEFLVMLLRAYPDVSLPAVEPDSAWYEASYALAEQYHWPVRRELTLGEFDRGKAAELIAAAQGERLGETDAVRYLLAQGLSKGKTSATVEGYEPDSRLTRAETLTFIRNMRDRHITLKPAPEAPKPPFSARGIRIGNSEAELVRALGEPDRKDASVYGFTWYVYNQDYERFVQAGVQDGRVVALYSNADVWETSEVSLGDSVEKVKKAFGEPLVYLQNDDTKLTYLIDGVYTTIFLDRHEQNTVTAILLIEQKTEEAFTRGRIEWNDELRQAFERQAFDLANAARATRGLPAFEWNDALAAMARSHSKDMAERGYFDHVSPDGVGLAGRLEANEIAYSKANENIAAGQLNALFAHADWMNSTTGHRDAILSDNEQLGVGVYFNKDDQYGTYFTENFIIPR